MKLIKIYISSLPHANYEKLIVLTLKVAQPGIPYLKLLRYLMSKFSIIPPPKDSSSADDYTI